MVAIEPYAASRDGGSGATESGATTPSHPTRRQHHHSEQPGLVRHGLRHTALTWMADAGVDLHILQRVAGHQDPAVTARYLHPDVQAMLKAGTVFSAWWSVAGPERPSLGVIDGGKNIG